MTRYMLLAFALTACGGGINSGLDADATLGSLTADQVCDLENATNDYAQKKISQDDACVFAGQFAALFSGTEGAEFTTTCETARDECRDAPEETADTCTAANASVYAETCTATVAQAEECGEEQVEALIEVINIGCDYDALIAASEEPEAPESAACAAVYDATCF